MITLDTRRGISPTRACQGEGVRGGRALGETPNVDDRVIDRANHHSMCILM